jgi:hypothetical protein
MMHEKNIGRFTNPSYMPRAYIPSVMTSTGLDVAAIYVAEDRCTESSGQYLAQDQKWGRAKFEAVKEELRG